MADYEYIESLQLQDYRNYAALDLALDKGTNILYGDNAQGKTNILEAIYLCGTSRSYRGGKDKDLIRFDQMQAHVRMKVWRDDLSYRLDMHLRKDRGKGLAVNGVPLKKAKDLVGMIHLVFFSPEDLDMIKEGPAKRRRFIDAELCQLDPIYLSDLSDYARILVQRNRLLKDLYFRPSLTDTLDIWDEQLVRFGKRIIEKREAFVEEVNDLIKDLHHSLSGSKETIRISYEPNCTGADLEESLSKSRERDIRQKTSCVGPHRDDINILINGIDIRRYGSQGQQRTAALSLKLSELYLIKKKIGQAPILLLDDVLSELDRRRQACLLERIGDLQALITCTGLEDFVESRFHMDRVFQVKEGKLTKKI